MRALTALVLLAACDPNFTFRGSVTDAAGRPIPNVKVALVCYGSVQDTTVTDEHGRFKYRRTGAFGDSCSIEVRDGDRAPIDFPIMQHCTQPYRRGTCTEVTLDVRLR